MENLEVIICTENGRLERLSKLLVYSIRTAGGPLKNVPVYSYSPRQGYAPSPETIEFLRSKDVICVTETLNTDYVDYPLANKPIVTAHHERESKAEFLLFIDSDSLIIGEPIDLIPEGDAWDIRINPVDYRNIATDITLTKGEARYWKSMYDLLGVKRRQQTECMVDNSKTLEYYNSGFVVVKREQKIFQQWLKNFSNVMAEGLAPSKGRFFVEQSVLSATIAQMNLNVCSFGVGYNYPIATYARKWRGFYPYSFARIRHIHYHKLFENTSVNRIEKKLSRIPCGNRLNEKIQELLIGVTE